MKITFNELKDLLAKGPTTFKFRKMNGELRRMVATTNPQWFVDETGHLEQMSDDALTVYDMEEKEWRRVSTYTTHIEL